MQTIEDFKKDIASKGETLKRVFNECVAKAESYEGEKSSLLWHTYTRNRDLQKRFIEEIEHAVTMPDLAPEVLGMRYRLWQEFVTSVEALGGMQTPAPQEEKKQDLMVYKDKHPEIPPTDDLAVVSPKPLPTRVKPKPTFTSSKPEVKKVPVAPKKRIVADIKAPAPLKKPMETVVPKTSPKKEVPVTEAVAKIRQSIIERVVKSSQGFLDGIFGSLGNEDGGLSKIQHLTLENIIAIEQLSPDAHTAKLDDLGVTQKEWEGWIDWANESNRVLPATVSATLGEYVDQVATHIAQKR